MKSTTRFAAASSRPLIHAVLEYMAALSDIDVIDMHEAFAARMVTTVANELATGQMSTSLLGICAAGGLGAGAVLEAVG